MVTTQPPGGGTAEANPPQAALIQMANRYRLSQCIHAAARLGIADLLADGPRPVADLAHAAGCHAGALYRLLRALAGLAIFEEQQPGTFALTPLARTLQSKVPGSLRASALVVGEEWHWRMWGELLFSLKTGRPAFTQLFGRDFATYAAEHPEAGALFNEAMESVFTLSDRAILDAYDFSRFQVVVDVGVAGGYGSLMRALLTRYPDLVGVLTDLPEAAPEAERRIASAGLSGRCRVVAGGFFDPLPTGGDCYVYKNVIHDFDDDQAGLLLGRCREAIAPDGRVLLVEMVVGGPNQPGMGKLVDIEALIMTEGGRERTEDEYRQLLASSGFTLLGHIATRSPISILEAAPA